MPSYDFHCPACDHEEERAVSLNEAQTAQKCPECSTPMLRKFPVEAALGFIPFKPYYHEALDMDINGFRERDQIYRSLGVQEAGDSVGGARNIETSRHAVMMNPEEPRGLRLADFQRRRDDEKKAIESVEIGVRDVATGRTRKTRAVDLKSYAPKPRKDINESISKAVDKGIAAMKGYDVK